MVTIAGAVRELARLLAAEGATADGVAEHIGVVTRRSAGDVEVVPHDREFERAVVVRRGDAPAHVKLVPEAPATVAELEAAFGEAAEHWARHDGERRLHFTVPTGEAPHEVTLVAAMKGAAVVELILRRDARTS